MKFCAANDAPSSLLHANTAQVYEYGVYNIAPLNPYKSRIRHPSTCSEGAKKNGWAKSRGKWVGEKAEENGWAKRMVDETPAGKK